MGERTFHVVGTEEFGYSTINRYWFSFYQYMNIVKKVCELYPYASVKYLKGYVAHFCYIRLKSFDTLAKVLLEHKDYVSANCILRMLGDCITIFRLVYMEPNPDYRILRHSLYVIDGCERNLAVLPEGDINKGCIPDKELELLKKQALFNREHRERLMREAQEMLDNSPLKASDEHAFAKIVEDRNWKFKEFKNYKKTGSNQYKWKDLYDLIGKCDNFDVLSYISQYAHGLSMSNLIINLDEQNIDEVLAEVVGLIDRMINYMSVFFAEERLFILEGLFEPEMRDKILACYDEKHRPSIDQWNNMVLREINA